MIFSRVDEASFGSWYNEDKLKMAFNKTKMGWRYLEMMNR